VRGASIHSFKQATVIDGKFTAAQVAMADAALQAGEMDAALSGLKQAVQNDPKNADASFALASLYDRQLDLHDKAARAYADFVTRFPSDARAGDARARARELAPALQFPEYIPAPSSAPSGVVTARVVDAAAVAPLPPTRTIQYRKPAERNTRAAVQAFNRGNYYQGQGRWDDAINFYLRSLESDDQLAGTWYNLGAAYTVKRDFDLAKDAYLRALAAQPTLDNARYNLALIYREQNDRASAITLLKEVVRNQPGYGAAHYVLGYLYADNAATIPLAKQHYQEFLRLSPADPAARAVQQWLSAHP
jgi:tetratricopeptide (TPR) repeat protein